MADVFKDFLVVIESADGTRRGKLPGGQHALQIDERDFLDEIVSVL